MQNIKTINTADQLKLLEAANAIAPGTAIYTVASAIGQTTILEFVAYRLPGEGGGGQPSHLNFSAFLYNGKLVIMALWRDRTLPLVFHPDEPARWLAPDASPTTQPSPLGAEFEAFAAAIFPIISAL